MLLSLHLYEILVGQSKNLPYKRKTPNYVSLTQIKTPHINPISCPETAPFQEEQVMFFKTGIQNVNCKH